MTAAKSKKPTLEELVKKHLETSMKVFGPNPPVDFRKTQTVPADTPRSQVPEPPADFFPWNKERQRKRRWRNLVEEAR